MVQNKASKVFGTVPGVIAAALVLFAAPVCSAGVITLNFEGIDTYPDASDVLIENYYNGGTASDGVTGPSDGVTFSSGATLLCLNTADDPSCSNTSKGGLGVTGSEFLRCISLRPTQPWT